MKPRSGFVFVLAALLACCGNGSKNVSGESGIAWSEDRSVGASTVIFNGKVLGEYANVMQIETVDGRLYVVVSNRGVACALAPRLYTAAEAEAASSAMKRIFDSFAAFTRVSAEPEPKKVDK